MLHSNNPLDLVNETKRIFAEKSYAFFEKGDYNLNIIGVRNPSGKADTFDDTMLLLYKKDGTWIRKAYSITTEPGTRILTNPIVSKGTAILIPGQYRSTYKIDIHGGKRKYQALCQRNGEVSVWRDSNRDRNPDYDGPVDTGMFGINIHRQFGPNDREYTQGVSAGCQVFQSADDFYEFMAICNTAADRWGNNFTYTLLAESFQTHC